MSQEHFVQLPLEFFRERELSGKAYRVCFELAAVSSRPKPYAFVVFERLAELCKCSVRHLRRILAWLERKGIIQSTGRYENQHPIFRLLWWTGQSLKGNCLPKLGQNCPSPRTEMSVKTPDLGQNCPPYNRSKQSTSKQSNLIYAQKERPQFSKPQTSTQDFLDAVLIRNEAKWSKRFPCFDGQSGRPFLRQKVAQILTHQGRKGWDDLDLYVESQLERESQLFMPRWNQEQNAAADSAWLSPEAKRAKEQIQQEHKQRVIRQRDILFQAELRDAELPQPAIKHHPETAIEAQEDSKNPFSEARAALRLSGVWKSASEGFKGFHFKTKRTPKRMDSLNFERMNNAAHKAGV